MSRLTLIELKFGSQTTSSTVRRPRSSADAEGDLTRWFPQCGVRPAYRQSRLEPRLVTVPGRTQTESEPHPRTGGAPAKRASAGHLDRVWPDTGPNGTVFEPRKGCADTSLPAMGRLRRGGAGTDGSARSTHDSTPAPRGAPSRGCVSSVELRGLEPLTLCMPCGNSCRAFVQVRPQIRV